MSSPFDMVLSKKITSQVVAMLLVIDIVGSTNYVVLTSNNSLFVMPIVLAMTIVLATTIVLEQ